MKGEMNPPVWIITTAEMAFTDYDLDDYDCGEVGYRVLLSYISSKFIHINIISYLTTHVKITKSIGDQHFFSGNKQTQHKYDVILNL